MDERNKMKKIIFISILLLCSVTKAEIKLKIYFEQSATDGFLYADNAEFCPVSLNVMFDLTNMTSTKTNSDVTTIPARAKKFLIAKISPISISEPFKFSYKTKYNLGDITQTILETDYNYYLPFKTSKSFKLHQGYNGRFSHNNKNALDFTMPIGTEVCAIRDGVIVKLEEKNDKNCSLKECEKFNNYLTIYHEDGTFAEYVHLKKNGIIGKIGDEVKKGQIIAYSGNTGFSTGPHLHLAVYLQEMEKRTTLKTKFLTGNASKSELLKEKNVYSRNY